MLMNEWVKKKTRDVITLFPATQTLFTYMYINNECNYQYCPKNPHMHASIWWWPYFCHSGKNQFQTNSLTAEKRNEAKRKSAFHSGQSRVRLKDLHTHFLHILFYYIYAMTKIVCNIRKLESEGPLKYSNSADRDFYDQC